MKRLGYDRYFAQGGDWGALVSESSGALVALAERADDRWQPRVVLHES